MLLASSKSGGKVLRPAEVIEDLKPLTSLRFVAAMMIVLQHATQYFPWAQTVSGLPLAQGVSFFFVLSGFILTHVYSKKKTTYGNFIWARIARLWPVHIVTCLMVLTLIRPDSQQLPGTGLFSPWLALASNLTLTQSLIPFQLYTFSWNSVSWSISTEMFFYLAFPFLFVNIERTWHWKLAICAGFIVVYHLVVSLAGIPPASGFKELNASFLTYASPLFRGFEFVLGMSSYVGWRWLSRLKMTVTMANLLEVAAVLIVAGWYYWAKNALAPLLQWSLTFSLWYSTCGACGIFAILIVAFASGKGLIGRFLSLRAFVWLGEISFALYMVHQILMKWFYLKNLEGKMEPASIVLVIGACIFSAAILHHLVENPARKLFLWGRAELTKQTGNIRQADAPKAA
jgi:peptidoglycan/LPS O-acetylase OafA/YrhL